MCARKGPRRRTAWVAGAGAAAGGGFKRWLKSGSSLGLFTDSFRLESADPCESGTPVSPDQRPPEPAWLGPRTDYHACSYRKLSVYCLTHTHMGQSKRQTFAPLPAVPPPGARGTRTCWSRPEPAGPGEPEPAGLDQNLLVQGNQNLLLMVLLHTRCRGACWGKSGGERGCRGWLRGRQKARGGGGGQR